MSDLIKKILLAGLGAFSLTREKVEDIIDDLVKRGELSREEKPGILADLAKAAEKRQNEVREFVQKEVQKVLKALDVPTRQEISDLQEQIEQLNRHEKSTE